MQLTLIVADPFVELTLQSPQASVDKVLGQCPALKKADWQLQTATPTQWMSAQWFGQTQNVTARLLYPDDTRVLYCLLPVHLSMQRDSFSLQGMLQLPTAIYTALTQQLQSYFIDEFTLETDDDANCWWVKPKHTLNAYSPWPQDCLFQSAFAWQPQGQDGQRLRQWSNEIQMLLHAHATISTRVDWPPLLNSLWFASVTEPAIFNHYHRTPSHQLIGKGRLYQGLQQGLAKPFVGDLAAVKAGMEVRYLVDDLSQVDWQAIQVAYQRGLIQRLQCILPFAERSVLVTLPRHRRWQFWRKPHRLPTLIETLTRQLQSSTAVMSNNPSGRT